MNTASTLILEGLSRQSQHSYGTGQRRYLRFAQEFSLPAPSVLPVTETVLLAFIAWLFADNRRLAYNTAKSYVSHLKHLSSVLGHNNDAFSSPRVKYALKGYGRRRGTGARRPKRIPITIQVLESFISLLSDSYEHALVSAILCVGVYGLFRSGELTAKTNTLPEDILKRSDAKWTEGNVTIRLRSSKTDPFRNGVDIVLVKNGSITCPYSALRTLWEAAPSNSPFAPLFQLSTGKPMRYAQLVHAIKLLAEAAGMNPSAFAGHSMRIGGATSLAQLGYPAHFIRQLGRWESLSFQLYTRLTENVRDHISQSLGSFSSAREPGRNLSLFGGMDQTAAFSASVDDVLVHFGDSSRNS